MSNAIILKPSVGKPAKHSIRKPESVFKTLIRDNSNKVKVSIPQKKIETYADKNLTLPEIKTVLIKRGIMTEDMDVKYVGV